MKKMKRLAVLLLALCLLATLLPSMTLQAKAAGYYNENDLKNIKSSVLTNASRANYVNTMMKYHILSAKDDYRVSRNLENGKSVVFFFDGCSDNVDDSTYGNYNKYHLSAYCAVVKKVNGVLKIVYESENCSTIPDNPRNTSLNDGTAVPTVLDGVYNIVSTNHLGRYASLRIADSSGSVPVIRCTLSSSYISTSNAINIHARSNFSGTPTDGISSTSFSSTGCFLVGLTGNNWSGYNNFINAVLGISNAIITTPYSGGQQTKCTEGVDKGVVVVDRSQYKSQLAAIYGADNSFSANGLVSKITAYTDNLNDGKAPDKTVVSVGRDAYAIGDTIKITWTAEVGTTYYWINVYKDDKLVVNKSMETKTSYTIENAEAGSYKIVVSANNGAGNSGGGVVNFTVDTLHPPVISANQVSYTTGETVVFTWEEVENAASYVYYLSEYPEEYAYTTNVITEKVTKPTVSFDDLPNGRYVMFVCSVSSSNKWSSKQSNWVTFCVYDDEYTPVKTIVKDGHMYALFDNEMSWDFAKILCKDLGGHLATVTSAQENALIKELVAYGQYDAYWLGASNVVSGSFKTTGEPFKWVTGETFEYSNWKSGEPSQSGEKASLEHFLEIRKSYDYQWNDTSNTNKKNKGFILEIDDAVYTVSYNANGGTDAPDSQEKYYDTTLVLSSKEPSRTGYTFLGWATSSTAKEPEYLPGDKYVRNTSVTLYAVWEANTYYVIYDANGGIGGPSKEEKIHGVDLILSSKEPTRTGYTFLGWSTSSTASTGTYNAGGKFTVNKDTTLYAIWSANKYYLEYNANGGTGGPEGESKYYDKPLTISSEEPTRTGYTFLGWATTATATKATYQPGDSFNINEETTLYAVWEAKVYGVIYDDNGGTGGPTKQVKKHDIDLILSSEKPTRTGYTFLGWATSATATNATYQPGDIYSENVRTTLYAVWKKGCENGAHSYGGWKTREAASCTEDGEQYRTCSKCSHEETKVLPATGHSYTNKVTAPTCTTSGYTTHTCSCGHSYKDTYTSATGHSYSAKVTAPTCTSQGYTTHTCSCGNSYKDSYTRATGHSYGNWKTRTAATCTADGEEYRICGKCNGEDSRSVAALGHLLDSEGVCKRCGNAEYTISYNANGGTGAPANQTKNHNKALTLSNTRPARTGFSFLGWSADKNAATADYLPGDAFTVNANTTLYAVWKAYFADVSVGSWQFSAVNYAVERNLMAGKGKDGNGSIIFDPNKPISREEFVQVLYNAENKPSVSIANKFPDVGNNAWYKNAVLWANSKNIANGMGNGNFGVGKNITRQDLALMLYKYAALKGLDLTAPTGEINKYADGDKVSGYAKTAMNWAVKNGVLSGKGAAGADISTFHLDPTGTATRAECAAMLKNFMTAFGL